MPGIPAAILHRGAVIGFSTNKSKDMVFQLAVKVQYNTVAKYEYYWSYQDRERSEYSMPEQVETLNECPKPFWSVEPAASVIFKIKPGNYLKMQLGYNYVKTTLEHHYVYDASNHGIFYTLKTDHPTSLPVNLSFAYFFCSKGSKKP